ncbi:MAG: hypothetical protein Hyperionvirus16_17 [Hyperionvirus sp.]|uniref:Uncharacterized protein n=1 Tax=Hyperionvirus sp. TaxID=2487770 RepID=A0A3G5AAC2_9VIRU|nr:MAG: hypothetical protein Hyperionvirus16_17 [Hyperionvirus sp.]
MATQIVKITFGSIMGTVGTSIFTGNFLTGSYLDQKIVKPRGDFFNLKYALGKGFITGFTAPLFVVYASGKWAVMSPSYVRHKETGMTFNKNGPIPYIFPGYRTRKEEFEDIK